MLRLDDLSLFVCTADRGSLSAAARELDISPAVASAALKRLEAKLETRLLIRSTRSLRLTPEGEQFLVHAREALRSLEEGGGSWPAAARASAAPCSCRHPRTSAATCCCPGSTPSRPSTRAWP